MIKRQQIAAARMLLTWTRSELANAAGISLRTLARFESGEGDITATKLEKLEEALLSEGIEFLDGGVALQRLKRTRPTPD
ncbi:helix-turn-helix domain-containing protein [Actibacterium sp. 188UL27-1]|uniref:helix-turn-helix domain-containing protein n=1 Tax=Actibacterium sp. 188UL27-1 TaxID=2786961 RepID=UPI00195D2A16|nr:helix-turn-helix transcriptional regulator [Actibacterium sp. 188UL27-1]MBM7069036.1 helix-turn-helix transcriptional regulator [Actibacterium sp. 188UL27-1]